MQCKACADFTRTSVVGSESLGFLLLFIVSQHQAEQKVLSHMRLPGVCHSFLCPTHWPLVLIEPPWEGSTSVFTFLFSTCLQQILAFVTCLEYEQMIG